MLPIHAPDDVAAGVLLKTASGGACTTPSTPKLISVGDALKAFQQTGELPYRPPGASA
jgi:hypothetical protein